MAQGLLAQVSDPELQPYLGMVNGRAMLLGLEKIGDLSVPPEIKQKLGRLQADLTAFNFSKAKESMPGRLIGSLVDLMSKSAPRMSENLDIIKGQLRGAMDVSRAVQVEARRGMGKGWELQKDFQDSLPNAMHEVTDKRVLDAIGDKLPQGS